MKSQQQILVLVAATALLAATTAAYSSAVKPNALQRLRLRMGGGKKLREEVVSRYFDGVQKQSREQIVSCFDPAGTKIRDVCGVSNSERTATPDQLGDRCMEFLAAHPDVLVKFHLPPTCLHGKSRWVWANWYEEGTWSGESQGIAPQGTPLDVEGQTRFLVNDDLKIERMVVTRTFSDWEKESQNQAKK
uniref:SnoaL-like domain-containing protein n=1 Tax=Craspedostauros australis TaxID=1486917 RepID=A0A7R9ZPJ1_9STRA